MSPIFGEETDPTISWLEQVGKPHVAYVMQEGGAWESIEAAGKPVQVVELDAVLARWDAHASAHSGLGGLDVQVTKGRKYCVVRTWEVPHRYLMSGPMPVGQHPKRASPIVSTLHSLAELEAHLRDFFQLCRKAPSVEVEF